MRALALGLVELDDACLGVRRELLHACVLGDDRRVTLDELGLLALELVRAESEGLLATLDVLDLRVDERFALGGRAARCVRLSRAARSRSIASASSARSASNASSATPGAGGSATTAAAATGRSPSGSISNAGIGIVGSELLEDGDLVDDLLRRGRRLDAALALEERAQARAEPGLRLVGRHFSTLMMLRSAGPSTTTNIDGKMKSTVGNSILIGAFIAFSSAAA